MKRLFIGSLTVALLCSLFVSAVAESTNSSDAQRLAAASTFGNLTAAAQSATTAWVYWDGPDDGSASYTVMYGSAIMPLDNMTRGTTNYPGVRLTSLAPDTEYKVVVQRNDTTPPLRETARFDTPEAPMYDAYGFRLVTFSVRQTDRVDENPAENAEQIVEISVDALSERLEDQNGYFACFDYKWARTPEDKTITEELCVIRSPAGHVYTQAYANPPAIEGSRTSGSRQWNINYLLDLCLMHGTFFPGTHTVEYYWDGCLIGQTAIEILP